MTEHDPLAVIATIERLRPDDVHADPVWSHATLTSILTDERAASARRRRERWRSPARARLGIALAALATGALVATAGVVTHVKDAAPAPAPAPAVGVEKAVGGEGDVQLRESGRYRYVHRVQMSRMSDGTEVQTPGIEYFVPADPDQDWLERSSFRGTVSVTNFKERRLGLFPPGTKRDEELLAGPVPDRATLRAELLELAAAGSGTRAPTELGRLDALAWNIAQLGTASPELKAATMALLRSEPGVTVADESFDELGLKGLAISVEGDGVWYVIDPVTSEFRGVVGHPDTDPAIDGPQEVMWVMRYEYGYTDEAPTPNVRGY